MPRGWIRWGAAMPVALALSIAPPPALAGSPNVAALQAALKAKGTYAPEVDGVAGPITRAATIQFQRRAAPDRGRSRGAADSPCPRPAWPPVARASRARPAAAGLGRGRAPVPALAPRVLAGAIDGGFGPGTGARGVRLQRSVGIAADGLVGNQTLSALRRRALRAPTHAGALLPAAAGTDGRRLRPHRWPPPHGIDFPSAPEPGSRRPGAAS